MTRANQSPATKPRDASTVLLLRDGPSGPEIYMVKRHRGNKFMAEAYVFVGGRADQADSDNTIVARCSVPGHQLAETLGIDDAERGDATVCWGNTRGL